MTGSAIVTWPCRSAAVGTGIMLGSPDNCRKPAYSPKKKVLSFLIGPPNVPPNSFLCRGGTEVAEEIARVKVIVPHEFKSAAMELVGSGFAHDLRNRAGALSVLGGVVVLLPP